MKSAILFVLLGVLSGVAWAGAPATPPFKLLWAGTFASNNYVLVPDPRSTTGKRPSPVGPYFPSKESTSIAVRLDTSFGVSFKYEGEATEEAVQQRVVWRFPQAGVVDRSSGSRITVKDFERACKIGTTCTLRWKMSDPSEMVEGKWVLQVWVGTKVVLHQIFDISIDPNPDAAESEAESVGDYSVVSRSQCPIVAYPEMPRNAIESRLTGMVNASGTIVDGRIENISLTGAPEFYGAVTTALNQYQCKKFPTDIHFVQEFKFKIDDSKADPFAIYASAISSTCPRQVAPMMPRIAIESGLSGKVVAKGKIVNGRVEDITFTSGPPEFFEAITSALKQFECLKLPAAVYFVQEFEFRITK
jgi:hypothetical protein